MILELPRLIPLSSYIHSYHAHLGHSLISIQQIYIRLHAVTITTDQIFQGNSRCTEKPKNVCHIQQVRLNRNGQFYLLPSNKDRNDNIVLPFPTLTVGYARFSSLTAHSAPYTYLISLG